ncbi:MAG: GNAT family N-acetyltransferase [Lewinellaceae bacterium]|nr:GNAT family N-acetyltransferase [Lewinellaceae bacterium]
MKLLRTTSDHPDFLLLVALLDQDLAERDGPEHAFYAQFNKVDSLRHVVVAYENGTPAGCGAFKPFDSRSVEIKRMFVQPALRGKGVARPILSELEQWAAELGYGRCVLETGKRQPEAIAFYSKCGYGAIPNFGQYAGVDNSVCFEKNIGQGEGESGPATSGQLDDRPLN